MLLILSVTLLSTLGWNIIEELALIDCFVDLFPYFLKNGPILTYLRVCCCCFLLKSSFLGKGWDHQIVLSFLGLRHSGAFGLELVLFCAPGAFTLGN